MKEEAKQVAKKLLKKKIMAFIIANLPIILGIVLGIFGTILIFIVLMQPIDASVNWVKDAGQNINDFFNKFDHFLKGQGWSNDEEAFLKTLKKKHDYYYTKGVIINEPLIMSTLLTKQLYTTDDPSTQDFGESYENFDEGKADVMSIPYGNMIGDMRKLVEHQVNKTFNLPSIEDPIGNVSISNASYLAYLRFGNHATKEQIDEEKAGSAGTNEGESTKNIGLTHYYGGKVGLDGMSPNGYRSERFRLNEKGWWMYTDPTTEMEYLAVAAPTTDCLNVGCGKTWAPLDGITYYEYGDVIPLSIEGKEYRAMVIDFCGECMESNNPLKISVYVSEEYFGEDGITQKGIEAGAVIPDSLPTTIKSATVSNVPKGFWTYKEPTNEERNQADKYKNGYIYNAYREAFKDYKGNDLEGQALVLKAEEIIETIYNMQESYQEYANNSSVSSDEPIEQRTTRPSRNNIYYYSNQNIGFAGGFEGECAWYGTGRAAEFLASINSTESWTENTHGGQFCDLSDAKKFNMGTEPKAGSLVSWSYQPYGHVAFVEQVNEDGTFNISEAATGFGMYGNTFKSLPNKTPAVRMQNCEGNGTGCFNYRTNVTKSLFSGFKCFIYLREPKNGGNQ